MYPGMYLGAALPRSCSVSLFGVQESDYGNPYSSRPSGG